MAGGGGGLAQGDTSRSLKGGATQETGSMIIKHVEYQKPSTSTSITYIWLIWQRLSSKQLFFCFLGEGQGEMWVLWDVRPRVCAHVRGLTGDI